MNPKVSVIIPIYNMSAYLRQCLDSVISQNLTDIEILCINDGSTDNSAEIVMEYADKDPRILYLYQNNQGSAVARNNGIIHANGEYIAFMDPDDWYPDNDILSALYFAAIQNKVMICGGSAIKYSNGKYLPYSSEMTFLKNQMKYFSEFQYPYCYWAFIYNRLFLKNHSISFPLYLRGQDPSFFVKAMTTANSFYVLDKITYCYRLHHKKVQWNREKANHFLMMIRDLFQISNNFHYQNMYLFVLRVYLEHYYLFIKSRCDCANPEFISRIREINTLIHVSIFTDCSLSLPDKALLHFHDWLFHPCAGSHNKNCLSAFKSEFLYLLWQVKRKIYLRFRAGN